ncbi:hypothetical protein [Pseudonocardia nigra]|uniref:hypothetical protein n=1 Tax=Pseudonocardia nigra TaxID=1921578 RepID=UPI001C5FBBF1|nr:hypothetical protein [Pseudonocardia nigra]
MKLRLIGTEAECAAAIVALAAGFELREVSGFYPNRGATVLGRVYVDAEPWQVHAGSGRPSTGRVRATTRRTDQHRREVPGDPNSPLDRTGDQS